MRSQTFFKIYSFFENYGAKILFQNIFYNTVTFICVGGWASNLSNSMPLFTPAIYMYMSDSQSVHNNTQEVNKSHCSSQDNQ